MNHEESKLQQQCVAWFRAQYPQYAMLLTHPINEGSKNTRTSGAIHKAEGTVAGVPDLILFLPAVFSVAMSLGLGIEFKTKKGSQSQAQKEFQIMFKAAGYEYQIVRSFDEFVGLIKEWMIQVDVNLECTIKETYSDIVKTRELKEKEKFYKVIGKK